MDNINWNLMCIVIKEKIDDLKAEIMYCGCTELNEYKVPKLKRLLALHEEEYKKLIILQQESNKEPVATVEIKYNKFSQEIEDAILYGTIGTNFEVKRKLKYDNNGMTVGSVYKLFDNEVN